MEYQLVQLSDTQRRQFQKEGFLILEKFLDLELVDRIDARLDPLFATQFETGVYPDEWHGRPGLNQPTATRQMCGMWRCDRTVASLSLSAEIARLNATLIGWSGGRLGTDSCWIKPPGAPEVLFHRNNTAFACIDPASVVTCWIALSDVTVATGTLEVVRGSHLWHCSDPFSFLHAPKDDYRQPLWKAAAEAGVEQPDVMAVEIPAVAAFSSTAICGTVRDATQPLTRLAVVLPLQRFPPMPSFSPLESVKATCSIGIVAWVRQRWMRVSFPFFGHKRAIGLPWLQRTATMRWQKLLWAQQPSSDASPSSLIPPTSCLLPSTFCLLPSNSAHPTTFWDHDRTS